MFEVLFIIIFILPLSFILYILQSYSKCKNNSQRFVNVQCWFCNSYHKVLKDLENCWDCPNCDQYNGFSKDGGYNKPILAQYDSALNAKSSLAKHEQPTASFASEQNGLCDRCNANQCFKVAGLNKFSPRNQKNYDREYREYSQRLEQLYPLCGKCERFLHKKIEADKYILDVGPKINHKAPLSQPQIRAPPLPAQQCLAWLNFFMASACLAADYYHGQGNDDARSSSSVLAQPELYRNFCRYIIHVGCAISFVIMYMGPPNALGRRDFKYRNKGLDNVILATWFCCLITRSVTILTPGSIYNLDKGLFALCLVRLFRRSFLAERDSMKNACNSLPARHSDRQHINSATSVKSALITNLKTEIYCSSIAGSDIKSRSRVATTTLSRQLNDSCSISGESPESVKFAGTIPSNIFLQKPKLNLAPASNTSPFNSSFQRFCPMEISPEPNGLHKSPVNTKHPFGFNTRYAGVNRDPIKNFVQPKRSPQHYSPLTRDYPLARLSGFRVENRTHPAFERQHLYENMDRSSSLCDDAASSINGESPESLSRRYLNFDRAPPEACRAYALLQRRNANWPTAGPMLILFGLGLSVGVNSVCAWIYLNRHYYNHLPY